MFRLPNGREINLNRVDTVGARAPRSLDATSEPVWEVYVGLKDGSSIACTESTLREKEAKEKAATLLFQMETTAYIEQATHK